jgi:hypothetical protein
MSKKVLTYFEKGQTSKDLTDVKLHFSCVYAVGRATHLRYHNFVPYHTPGCDWVPLANSPGVPSTSAHHLSFSTGVSDLLIRFRSQMDFFARTGITLFFENKLKV